MLRAAAEPPEGTVAQSHSCQRGTSQPLGRRLGWRLTEPILHLLLSLLLHLWSDVHRDRGDRSRENSEVIGIAHDWYDVGNSIERRDEISEGAVDNALGPKRSVRILSCIIELKRTLNDFGSRGLGVPCKLVPETFF